MDSITVIRGLWVVGRHLPAALVRLYFTRERLANLIYVDIRPRHSGVTIQLASPAFAEIYLQLINLAPVPVELDRAEFRLMFGGSSIKTFILQKRTFQVGEIVGLYMREVIPDSSADQMVRGSVDNPVSLDGHIEFNCSLRSFPKTVGALEGIQARFMNWDARRAADLGK
jgi:hypothetical protein